MKKYNIILVSFIFLFSMIITAYANDQYNPRFVDNGNGTVTDTTTGLMWMKSTPNPLLKPAVDWLTAQNMIEQMDFAGYTDWRMPTIEEWKTIIDTKNYFPALANPNPFQNVITHFSYWSSSDYNLGLGHDCDFEGCAMHSYVVQLYYGNIDNQRKDTKAFVWPVRTIRKMVEADAVIKPEKKDSL